MTDINFDNISGLTGADALAALFADLKAAIDGGDPAEIQAATEQTQLALQDADVTDEDVQQALEKVAVDPAATGGAYEEYPDHSAQGTLDFLQAQIEANNINTDVYQGQNLQGGDVHGNITNANESNVANATGEGSIAGDEVYDNQTQTGDGQQVGGHSGVQNQGDNSGQQAGYDAHADNVTSGDDNNVASGWSSGVGDGHTSLENVDVNDSAIAFGSGNATNEAPDTTTETVNFDTKVDVSNSGNVEASDDDSQYQEVDIHDHGYEPGYEEHDYKGDDHYDDHGHDHGHDHNDVDQHAVLNDLDDGILE